MNKLIAFLRDVRIELAKVSWPTRKETIRATLIVIIMSIIVAAFLGALDMLFQWILQIFVL
ncbi:MAG: preprotein translocase subunit SecE [Patescibacteria group bacterium]